MTVFLGDYIFGGVGSNEVVDLITEYSILEKIVIKGNVESLIDSVELDEDWIFPVVKQIYSDLGEERISFLKQLPEQQVIDTEDMILKNIVMIIQDQVL